METDSTPKAQIIQLNEGAIRDHLGEMVRSTVEDTLNRMLDAEANQLCNAEKYQRNEARTDTRAGHYQRKLHTKAGEVTLNVPKLRNKTFETAIIERYRRREASVEEALIEMYLAGVSVRRVEDITEALWGTKVSPGTISNLNKKVYSKIEEWRNRPIHGDFPYVYLDGIILKRSWGGEVTNVSVLVAIGVNGQGYRKILGVCEGAKEDKAGWSAFLRHLKERGLQGVRLFISDACMGLTVGTTDDETAWCSSFVNWCLQEAGIQGTHSALAATWLNWGTLCGPEVGAVTVIREFNPPRTRSGYHVGFWIEDTGSHFKLLGGNQSKRVKISSYPRSGWTPVGHRWPILRGER